MISGKKFQMVDGYTYGAAAKLKSCMRYRCTQGCGANLYKSFDGFIKAPIPAHSHPPPKLYLTSSGAYMTMR